MAELLSITLNLIIIALYMRLFFGKEESWIYLLLCIFWGLSAIPDMLTTNSLFWKPLDVGLDILFMLMNGFFYNKTKDRENEQDSIDSE